MVFEPIGFFRGDAARKYEAPRQGIFGGGRGQVELIPGKNFETALRDLDGFERIWLLFVFDRNEGAWRPTTRPPAREGAGRIGLFASRAPYRPNPIGLSCVRLLGVSGRIVAVDEADLLDGTPILDLKPYVPAADSFPEARAGWTELHPAEEWQVTPSPEFAADAAFVLESGGPDLAATAMLQLRHSPLDSASKRVESNVNGTGGTLSLRMFRIDFTIDAMARQVTLLKLRSGYGATELADVADPYCDKALHRAFAERRRANG